MMDVHLIFNHCVACSSCPRGPERNCAPLGFCSPARIFLEVGKLINDKKKSMIKNKVSS